jgi:hypothetical protein
VVSESRAQSGYPVANDRRMIIWNSENDGGKTCILECNAGALTIGSTLECVKGMPIYGNMKEIVFLTVVITCKKSLYIVRELFVKYHRSLVLSSPPLCARC